MASQLGVPDGGYMVASQLGGIYSYDDGSYMYHTAPVQLTIFFIYFIFYCMRYEISCFVGCMKFHHFLRFVSELRFLGGTPKMADLGDFRVFRDFDDFRVFSGFLMILMIFGFF